MDKFLKNNKITISILFVFSIIILYILNTKNNQNISTNYTLSGDSTQQQNLKIESNNTINNFISKLPIGDTSSEKCKSLVDDKLNQIITNNQIDKNIASLQKNQKDKDGYSQAGTELEGSKYIYSNKLCLANIKITRYSSTVLVTHPESNGSNYENQIVDLSTDEVIVDSGFDDISGHKIWFYNEEQKPSFDISNVWQEIQKLN